MKTLRVLSLCTLLLAPLQGAVIATQSGDIAAWVNKIPLPGSGSGGFTAPTDASIAAWRPVVDALFSGNYQTAANLADPLGYDVVQFNDTVRQRTYYVLLERQSGGAPLRGLGTYVFNPSACRNLSFHAPHAGGDQNTRLEAATLFADLNATALLVAGTHRCASSTSSTCDGSSDACGDGTFHSSDVAHTTQNYLQPAHEELLKTIPNLITVAIHGEGGHSPEVIISNGTCFAYPTTSVATLLADEYNRVLTGLNSGLSATTCNAAGGGSKSLCAEVDVQGRYANNSTSLCKCQAPTASACSTTLGCGRNITFPERFIHVEQTCQLRQVASCPPPSGVDFAMAVGVFAKVFPCSPKISAVVHGATFHSEPLAPGSFFSLFGDGLGTQAQAGATAAFSLGGIKAQICGQPARLVYNSGQGQVNGIVPIEVSGQATCSLTVSPDAANPIPSVPASTPVQIAAQNIGIFQYAVNASLTLPIITDAAYRLVGPPNTAGFVQAPKGGAVILWTTGGGLTNPRVGDDQLSPPAGATMASIPQVRIGGVSATLLYAGLTPGYIGLYQINVLVPPGTPSGKAALVIGSDPAATVYDLWVQ